MLDCEAGITVDYEDVERSSLDEDDQLPADRGRNKRSNQQQRLMKPSLGEVQAQESAMAKELERREALKAAKNAENIEKKLQHTEAADAGDADTDAEDDEDFFDEESNGAARREMASLLNKKREEASASQDRLDEKDEGTTTQSGDDEEEAQLETDNSAAIDSITAETLSKIKEPTSTDSLIDSKAIPRQEQSPGTKIEKSRATISEQKSICESEEAKGKQGNPESDGERKDVEGTKKPDEKRPGNEKAEERNVGGETEEAQNYAEGIEGKNDEILKGIRAKGKPEGGFVKEFVTKNIQMNYKGLQLSKHEVELFNQKPKVGRLTTYILRVDDLIESGALEQSRLNEIDKRFRMEFYNKKYLIIDKEALDGNGRAQGY